MHATNEPVNAAYASVAEAAALIPGTIGSLETIRGIFQEGGQDFMAVDIRIMMERLQELQDILINGDKG